MVGEGLAARWQLQRLLAKIAARGGGAPIPRDRLTAAEEGLAQAEAARSVSRRGVQQAQRDARGIPQTILEKQKTGPEVPEPAYVGHYPGKVSLHRFYSAYRLARGSLGRKRTGEAFRTGAYDHTWNGLVGQAANQAQLVAKASLHDRVVSRYGVTIPPDVLRQLGIRSHNGDLTPNECEGSASQRGHRRSRQPHPERPPVDAHHPHRRNVSSTRRASSSIRMS